ncbi:MAG: hypothetical protein ACM3ZE_14655 [Myxococcales bacterium]
MEALRVVGPRETLMRRSIPLRRLGCGLSVLGLIVCGFAAEARAAGPTPALSSTVAERDLPPLTPIPKLDPPPSTQSELDDLDALLLALRSEKLEERREAARDVLQVQSKSVAAILSRLDKLAGRADRDRMKRALAAVREKSRRDADPEGDGAEEARGSRRVDLLVQLVEQARPKDEGWRDLIELIGLSRMLTHVGNVYAARGLIEIYVRFGEFVRVDVQNRLAELGDGAVAALIEARRHRAEKVARWAERQLDRLGKGVPSEAIRTNSFECLADILRAYGRTKDPDAARIIVSYASSERFQIREAARQAIAMLGEVGLWQLRDSYENVVGRRPRRDWSWDRTARELFFEYDRLHAKKVYDLMDEGLKAASERRYEQMAAAFDALLAHSPQLEKAHLLAPGYFAYAEQVATKQPSVAEAALVRVERLATDPALQKRARSLRDTIRAEQLLQAGVVDAYLLQTAAEMDPANRRAKDLLSAGDRQALDERTVRVRWLTSGAVGVIAIVAILFVLLRRRGEPAPRQVGASDALHPEHDDGTKPNQGDARTRKARRKQQSTPAQAIEAEPKPTSEVSLAEEAPAPARVVTLDAPEAEPSTPEDAPPPRRRDPFEDL